VAAYLIAFARLKNAGRLPEYSAAALPTLVAAGGAIVTRGKVVKSLTGGFSANSCLIVKFNDAAAVEAWYQSPNYQALIPLRDEVMEPNFLVLEEPT
jgi:uncharacterized protein (DUF1330 family)